MYGEKSNDSINNILNFKFNIGDFLKNDKMDLIITDRKYIKYKNGRNKKYYKYKCNKCGFDCGEHYKNGEFRVEYLVLQEGLVRYNRCYACSNQITVPHINSIVAKEETHWMIPYFQGGYEEAKMYSPQSSKRLKFVCPDCGRVKDNKISISNLYNNKFTACCCANNYYTNNANILIKEGISYPEKFMISFLEQIDVHFKREYSTQWSDKKRYDFYIPSLNCIIETHGNQHYEETNRNERNLKQEQENDRLKRELALQNGIKYYIELDCRRSSLKWIKTKMLNSELNNLFDLDEVDWDHCNYFAMSSISKEVCQYWDKKEDKETTIDLAKKFNLCRETVIRYLKNGNCNYDPKEETKKSGNLGGKLSGKQIEIFKCNISLGVFESVVELDRQSENLFGVKLNYRNICDAANGKRPHHKGFTFKYIEENQNIAS